MLRIFDISNLVLNLAGKVSVLRGPNYPHFVNSLSMGSHVLCVPSRSALDVFDDNTRSRCCAFVETPSDLDWAHSAGVSMVCVRCPANDLLARLGHRRGGVFVRSAEALFVPAGAKLDFGKQYSSLDAAVVNATRLLEKASQKRLHSIVLLDSGLGCRYKAMVEVPELVDLTNTFLSDDLAQHVVWEEGPRGGFFEAKAHSLFPAIFIPRTAENLCKTAVAAGIDMSKVSFMLRNNEGTTKEVIRRLSSLSSRSAFLDCSGLSTKVKLQSEQESFDSPSSYLSYVQYLMAQVEAHGNECPEELLEIVESAIDFEDLFSAQCVQ